jgi:hypothetical protein
VGTIYDEIDGELEAWFSAQPLFFVATAPTSPAGHVNVSPKGDPCTFRVLDPHRVAYLDTIGSGAETIAHLRENGRVVVMFCAFAGPPRIVRLHGIGKVAQVGSSRFEELVTVFDADAIEQGGLADSLRSVIEIEVSCVADSCGYGVPLMQFEGWRPQGEAWANNRLRKHGPNALMDYSRELNATSIDGLPGIEPDLLPQRT